MFCFLYPYNFKFTGKTIRTVQRTAIHPLLITLFILKAPLRHLLLHWVPHLTSYPSQELVFQFSIIFILKGTYLRQTWWTLLLYLVFLSWLSPKYWTWSNLRKEGFLLAYISRWYSASWRGRQGDRNGRQLVTLRLQKKKSRERWILALFTSHSRPLLVLFIQSGIIALGIALPTLRMALPILVKSFWKLTDMPVVYLLGDIKASQIVMKIDQPTHETHDCSTRRPR